MPDHTDYIFAKGRQLRGPSTLTAAHAYWHLVIKGRPMKSRRLPPRPETLSYWHLFITGVPLREGCDCEFCRPNVVHYAMLNPDRSRRGMAPPNQVVSLPAAQPTLPSTDPSE